MSMWYKAESTEQPVIIDSTSSKKWVYVRKNIQKEEREDELSGTYEVYTFDEQKVSKDVWGIFEQEKSNEERLNDVEDVLAELIGGDIE